jgi:hypothetical protein
MHLVGEGDKGGEVDKKLSVAIYSHPAAQLHFRLIPQVFPHPEIGNKRLTLHSLKLCCKMG